MAGGAAAANSARQRKSYNGGKSKSTYNLNASDKERRKSGGRGQANLSSIPLSNSATRLHDSMPTLLENKKGSSGKDNNMPTLLDESMRSNRSNPEIYLNGSKNSRTRGGDIELRHRNNNNNLQNHQSSEQSSSMGLQNSYTVGTQDQKSPPSRLKAKDSFNENDTNNNMNNNNNNTLSTSAANNTTPPPHQHHKYLPIFLYPVNDARRFMGRIINDERVQSTVLLLIVINALMMGVATFPAIKANPDIMSKFELADQIFLIIFTIESGMQLLYHGWTLFKDGFLVFDLLIVVMSWSLEGAQVFRAFRIFRALRLITRVDTLRNLVLALFSVVPKMTAIIMLLALIFYIFAVMFTQMFKGMYEAGEVSDPFFDSLPDSFFTLFQMMTLDNWADICFEIQIVYPWAWVPFVCFIIITGFVVVNLIIAVICDAVHVLGNSDKANLEGYSEDNYPANNVEGETRQWLKGQSGDALDTNSFGASEGNGQPCTMEQRLHELELQLDEIMIVNEQMRKTIEVLSKHLQVSESVSRTDTTTPTKSDWAKDPLGIGLVLDIIKSGSTPNTDKR